MQANGLRVYIPGLHCCGYLMSFASRQVLGFLAGLALAPLVTKFVLEPLYIQSLYDEVDSIHHDLDYLGWKVRLREQEKGLKAEELYVPTLYYQARF